MKKKVQNILRVLHVFQFSAAFYMLFQMKFQISVLKTKTVYNDIFNTINTGILIILKYIFLVHHFYRNVFFMEKN